MEKGKIKCVFCAGSAEIKYETIELLGGKVILKQQPYYKCEKCKKEFITSKQMKETEKQLNVFSVTRPIVSTGRSLAITIPKDLAKFYKLKKGEKVQLIPESKHMLKIKIYWKEQIKWKNSKNNPANSNTHIHQKWKDL